MATRHEITSIQFKADAGKANAAIDSIRQEAAQAAEKVKELRKRLEEGKKANLPVEDIKALEKELERAEKPAKQWDNALKNLTKGVKALDQAIIAFNNGKGSVEGMSAALSKAARNAAQLQQSRVDKSNPTWHEMEALILALDKNLLKARQDVDGLIASLSQGDRVSSGELRTATTTLKELMDVTAQGTAEWKQYQSQLQSIEKYVATLSETERRLAGEVVTVADAMKVANTASREEAENRAWLAEWEKKEAATRREAAEQQAEASRQNVANAERELATTQEQIEAQKKRVASLGELEAAEEKAEKEADQAREAVKRQREEIKQFDDATMQAAREVGELKKRLEELKAQPSAPAPNPTLEGVKQGAEAAKASLEEVQALLKGVVNDSLAADGSAQEKLRSRMLGLVPGMEDPSVAKKRSALRLGGYSGFVDVDEQRDLGMGTYRRVKKFDDIVMDYFANLNWDGSNFNPDDDTPMSFVNGKGELFDITHLREFTEAEKKKIANMSSKQLQNFIMKLFKEQYGEVKAAISGGLNSDIWVHQQGGMEALKKAMNVEEWKGGSPVGVKETQEEVQARQALIAETQQLIQEERQLAQVQQQGTQSSQSEVDAIKKQEEEVKRLTAEYEKASKELSDLESKWQDQIADYVYEKYPTQATVSAKTTSPEGLKEREVMKKDPVLAKMREQQLAETEAAYERMMDIVGKLSIEEEKLREIRERSIETQQQSTQTSQEQAEVEKQLLEAQERLDKAKRDAEEPNAKLRKAEEDLTEAEKKEQAATEALAEAKKKGTLDDEEQKLDALKQKHRDLTQTISAEQQAIEQQQAAARAAAEEETRAAIEMAQAQNQSQEAVEQSIAVLEKAHKKTNDGTTEYTEQAEAIAKLKQRLAEMRGEAMSLADAEALAATAGKEGFKGTAQQLQMAEQTIQKALQTAQKGTPEWERYRKELERIRVEMQNMGMSSERMHKILDNPAAARNLNELKEAVKRAKSELALMEGTVDKNSKAYADLAKQTKNAEMRQKELESQSKGTASAFEKAWSRLKTYVGLYVGAAVAMQKVVATMGDLMELSDKMGEVRKTTGFTADEVGRLSENLKRMDTRTTLVDLLGIAAEAGTLGLKTQQDIQGFTEAANMLMVSLPEMGQEAAKQLMKIANATGDLKKNGGDVEETMQRVGSTIIALRANSASAAPEIADFASRVGAVGAQAGISIDQIVALGSTIDALGGRVEMSATALSRMIPAIRNNAFGVANAIGVTEKTLKDLFDQGRAMEAMVLIFRKMRESVQQFDTSTEEGTEAMAKNVEDLLGKNAAMADVMKELNQQGARAGIVFGLLSQNVDELERQLGIAGDAYKQNTALLNEYNNMNETTAAKWARLKNQLEEFFVGDDAQRWLGRIVDGLRVVVDWFTSMGNGMKTFLVMWSAFKIGIGQALLVSLPKALTALSARAGGFFTTAVTGLRALTWELGVHTVATGRARIAWQQLDVALKQNIFGAILAGLTLLVFKLVEWKKAIIEAQKEIGKWAQEVVKSEQAVTDSFKAVDKAKVSLDDANKKVREAKAALEAAKKQMDGSKESAERLTKAEDDLKKAEQDVTVASNAHKASIEKINSMYGQYLGFMLSEISSANELANARELINAKLRETITLKRKEAALGRVEESEGEDRDQAYGAMSQALSGAIRKQVVVSRTKDKNGKVVEKKGWATDQAASTELLRQLTELAQSGQATGAQIEKALEDAGLSIYEKVNGKRKITAYGANLRNLVLNYQKEYKSVNDKVKAVEQQFEVEASVDRKDSQKRLARQYEESEKTYTDLEAKHAKATGDARKKAAADLLKQADTLEGMLAAAPNYYDLSNKDEKAAYDKFVKDTQKRIDGIKGQRDQLLKEAGNLYKPSGSGGTGGNGATTPYGQYNPVTSPYSDWNADDLVKRRKEMLERVRTLAAGADVQAVLSEDAAFITKATRDNIKTTQQAIEWYNTERLKIQEALHEKHLTNTGDWMDPSKAKGRQKTIKDEWSAYLNELDAYYTERKAMIQEAQNDGEISEAEAWRRTLQNDAEWHQRRAELQKLYADKAGEVTQEEQNAIFAIIGERTGDTADFIQKTIGKTVKFIYDIGNKSEAEQRTIFGKLDKGIEQDFLRQRNAIGKQMKAIQDIIDKERPFNGLAENLRENMVKMDALMTDVAEGERTRAEETKRMMFLLQEAENAYALTTEQLLADMRQRGFGAWADALAGDDSLQRALLVQLHQTYDAVQDAIKKEASLIKKQAENVWSSILMPDGVTPLKQAMEQSITTLGLQKDSVSRANSLIGAGQASERVADRLAIKQMQVQLAMQQAYYDLVRKTGLQRIADLKAAAKRAEDLGNTEEAARLTLDAQHATMSLNLATTKEQTELDKQRVAIANQLEESQNRLYKELREWGDLIASSLQSVFEASNTGLPDFYNEIAKLRLTGDTGGGTYVVIDNAGTSDATAHYETYATEEEHLRRQLEIDQQNAVAEAWKKVMDDINQKMNDMITDQINAMLQNSATDANTEALGVNTQALYALAGALKGQAGSGGADMGVGADGVPNALRRPEEGSEYEMPKAPWQMTEDDIEKGQENMTTMWQSYTEQGTEAMMQMAENLQEYPGITPPWQMNEESMQAGIDNMNAAYQAQKDASDDATNHVLQNQQKMQQSETQTDKKMASSSKSMYAAMTAAANLYGVAYQAMQNDNLDMAQKFEMIALQAVGNAAIAALNVAISNMTAKTAANEAETLSKDTAEHGSILGPILFAVSSALIGGLVGLATSKITKSKAQIAQVTGASSASAGRLSTGMLTYAEGNVNEFTDPATLTPGRQYNVDAADGRTYRARYMGSNPRTHLTNGPEFHLSGERGREMIIDAGTTRQITMNEGEIWHAIQTLSGGGSLRALRSQNRRRGVRAFADGNLDDFEDGSVFGDGIADSDFGMTLDQAAALQASIDRQSDLLADLRANGIKAHFDVYGKGGLIDSYDTGKKTVNRHGERY